MTIHLRPEIEELIRQDIHRGPYQSVDEFVERAVQLLHQQEEWLSSHRSQISGKIEEGWKAAERGELIPDEEVRARMKARKQTRIDQNHTA